MPIDTTHPEYDKFRGRWRAMSDALEGEDRVKGAMETYLPKTGGMKINDADGSKYAAYQMRARFPEITQSALTGMVGLVFEQEPLGETEDVITNTGQTNTALARDVVRALASKGRDILVVDAPETGGEPFIARYTAESLINWKTRPETPNDPWLAVFAESIDDSSDMYSHDELTVYRQYLRLDSGQIEITRMTLDGGRAEFVSDPVILPIDTMPMAIIGSIDLSPACDPIPLLPVARCAFAYYLKSATYENGLYLTGMPTPYVACEEDQYDAIVAQGIGSNALWYLGNDGTRYRAGYIEPEMSSLGEVKEAMQEELVQAESYAIRLTQQGDGVESAASLSMRANTQHASIYSMADAASLGITRAMQIRAAWAGDAEPEPFKLRTDFTPEYAGEQMIRALNEAVNAGNAPRSTMYEAIRRSGLSEKTDEEMDDEIAESGAVALSLEPVAATSPIPVEDAGA